MYTLSKLYSCETEIDLCQSHRLITDLQRKYIIASSNCKNWYNHCNGHNLYVVFVLKYKINVQFNQISMYTYMFIYIQIHGNLVIG